MRRFCYVFLSIFCCALIYAQPVLQIPAKTVSTLLTTTKPTFKWNQVSGATLYEFFLTGTALDTTSATIPNAAYADKLKRYVSVGTQASDTTFSIDTILVKNYTYYWKVRAKVGGSFGAWSKYFYFKIGMPNASVTNAGNATITFNHDTISAITRITFLKGSGQQLLDATYNDTKEWGLGGNAQKDTIIAWDYSKTDTSIFTYQNSYKYGKTGSRVLTVAHGASGITVDVVLKLETGKNINMSTAWKPGGTFDAVNNNVVLVKNTATKTQLTYTSGAFGPDSINLSAMYNKKYNEYFGFKSSSNIAVKDTQSASLLKQTLNFSNSTGSLKTFNFSFAVRKTRAEYFDAWADNRPIIISKPATDDSLLNRSTYVVWESFGAKPDTIKFSSDGGSTYGSTAVISKDTTTIDSVQYTIPSAAYRNNCVLKVISDNGDVAVSGVFKINAPYALITSPKAGDNVTIGQHYIVWNNTDTNITLTKVDLSLDSGKTYSAVHTGFSSTGITDSILYDYYGAKTASAYCMVRVYGGSDTIKSDVFSLGKGTATFSIPTMFGDPAGTVSVPISVKNYIFGDSVKAFDLKLTFDSTYLKYTGITYNASLNNWVKIMDSSNAQLTNYVRVSAFKNTTGSGVKNSELFKLNFTIKNKQSIIGESTPLTIVNSVLSAAGNNASSLDVSGSTDGILKIYSSISGNIRYLHEKWDGSPSYPVSGDSLIVYFDSTNSANNSWWPVVNGAFNLTNREPNDTINFYPSASKYMGDISAKISVIDATLAFKSWYDTLSTRALIAADVNEDSLVNTTDAMAIMEISVDTTYLTGVGLTNWLFIDSTSLAGFESAADSLTGWYTKHQHSLSYKLVAQRTNQNFFGVLRGDVDFDFATAAVNTMKKSNVNPVLFNTDAKFNVRPGDTVWIPLNIYRENNVIGGFNASMQVDPKIFTYTGEFKTGQSIPQDKNWYITAKSDAQGKLRVAGTDFSLNVTPISQDGAALLFKYIVNKNVKVGTLSQVGVKTQTVVDSKMRKMTSSVMNGQVEISRMGSAVVANYELAQNYPNPFNPTTTIEFALPKDSKVTIEIFNIIGQKVATLFNGNQTIGYHNVEWNATSFGSGVYFYMINASTPDGDKFRSVKKLMLLK